MRECHWRFNFKLELKDKDCVAKIKNYVSGVVLNVVFFGMFMLILYGKGLMIKLVLTVDYTQDQYSSFW